MAAIVFARPGHQIRLATPLESAFTEKISRMLLISHHPLSKLIYKYTVTVCLLLSLWKEASIGIELRY